MKTKSISCFFILFLMILNSCKSTKKPIDIIRNKPEIKKQGRPDYKVDILRHIVDQKEINTPLEISGKIKLTSPKVGSQRANLKIKKSLKPSLSIAVSFLGIKVANALLDGQNLKYSNHFNREYYIGSLAFLKNQLGINNLNYNQFERLILGESLEPISDSFDYERNEQTHQFSIERADYVLDTYWKNDFKLYKQRIKNKKDDNWIDIFFDDYKEVYQGHEMPTKISIFTSDGKTKITLEYSRILPSGEDLDLNFLVPNGYKKLSL